MIMNMAALYGCLCLIRPGALPLFSGNCPQVILAIVLTVYYLLCYMGTIFLDSIHRNLRLFLLRNLAMLHLLHPGYADMGLSIYLCLNSMVPTM